MIFNTLPTTTTTRRPLRLYKVIGLSICDVFSQNQSYVPNNRTEITEYEGKIFVFNQNKITVALISFVSLPSYY